LDEESQLDFNLSQHAEEELVRRRIPRIFLDEVLQHPAQIVGQHGLEKVYQSRLDFGDGKIYFFVPQSACNAKADARGARGNQRRFPS